jgi:NTP pyrophosphatase (non-canonical NTP hydrolase)
VSVTITVRPFRLGTDKDAALKPLEEGAEVYGSWQMQGRYTNDGMPKTWFADEIADCVTACVNLAVRYHIDLQAAIDRVEARNRERGRYA